MISCVFGYAALRDGVGFVRFPFGAFAELTVSISFNWNEDGENSDCVGTVTEILYTASEGEDVTYTAYVDFEAGEEIRLGMGCVVYTLEDAVEEEVDEAQSE